MKTIKLCCLLLLALFAIPYARSVIADDTGQGEKAFQGDVLRSYEPSNIGMRTGDAYNNAKNALDNLTDGIDSGYKQAKRRFDQMFGFMPSDEELNSPVDPARPDLKGLPAEQISKRRSMGLSTPGGDTPIPPSHRDDSLGRLMYSGSTQGTSSSNSLHDLIQNQRKQEEAQDALDKAQRAAQLAEMKRQQQLAEQQRQIQLAEQQRQQARAAQRVQAEAEAEIAQNREKNADALLGVMGAFSNALGQRRTSMPVSAPSYQPSGTTAPSSPDSSECIGGCFYWCGRVCCPDSIYRPKGNRSCMKARTDGGEIW